MAKAAQKIKAFNDSEKWGDLGLKFGRPAARARAAIREEKKAAKRYAAKMGPIIRARKKKREAFHKQESDLWA